MRGAVNTAATGDLLDVLEDVGDFVTSDTFFTIVGTAITLGSYGYVSGVLTALQDVAVQEGMKAVAGGVALAAQRYAVTGKVTPPGFLEAWQGQVAYRTKKMVAVGGPGFVAGTLAYAAQLLDPAVLQTMQQAWEIKKKTAQYARDAEAAKVEYLGELERACLARTPGPINPDPNAIRDICRQDTLAQAANLANGETLFETTDWNPASGARVDLGKLTAREARDRFYEVVRAVGSANTPEAEAAIEVFRAAERRELERAERAQLGAELEARVERDAAAGMAGAASVAPRIRAIRARRAVIAAASNVPQRGAERPEGSTLASFVGQLAIAAILTSPAWLTIFVVPALRARQRGPRQGG